MLNLEPRNEIRVQTPEENNKILFLNEEGEVVLKNDANEIEPLYTPSYKVYTALLTQTGTDAPVATAFENTIGITPIISRSNVGLYTIEFPGLLPIATYGKIFINTQMVNISLGIPTIRVQQGFPGTSIIAISCYSSTNNAPSSMDSGDFYLEVRVYP